MFARVRIEIGGDGIRAGSILGSSWIRGAYERKRRCGAGFGAWENRLAARPPWRHPSADHLRPVTGAFSRSKLPGPGQGRRRSLDQRIFPAWLVGEEGSNPVRPQEGRPEPGAAYHAMPMHASPVAVEQALVVW